jgi:putative FmdB family regulatory protein
MPLYEYECDACGQRFEVIQKFSDPAPEACRKCGKGPVHRQASSPAIQFKGTGWYVTDYANKGKSDSSTTPAGKTSDGGKSDAASSSSSDSGAGKSDGATGESKSESRKGASSKSEGGKSESGKSDSPKSDSTPSPKPSTAGGSKE